ncbi:MAG: long-chain-fatty-acid--CoA ligase [Herpetosiphonaceae bacterium]|nr:MAG: long-chain-fatty-acid--CoA ligase [Herpetosiphonaceae bacterium]
MEHTKNVSEPAWYRFYDQRTPRTLTYPEITIDYFLDEAAGSDPDKRAVTFILKYLLGGRAMIGGKLTYRQLREAADRFATALADLGVRKGDRIAVMLPNSPQFVIAFFAAMRLGAVVVNTNPTYTPREIKHQVEDSGAETIVLLNLFLPRLREIQSELPHLKRVIVTHIFDTLPFPSSALVRRAQKKEPDWVEVQTDDQTLLFGDLLKRYPPAPPKVERSPNDVALFQYTGGTTGLPKAAMLTHRNIVSNVLQIKAWLPDGQRGTERVMCAIPFFHVYGMTVAMLYSVAMAADMLIVPNPRPIDNVMRIIDKERATVFPGVPAMYIGIINHPDLASYNLRSVRACISGSAPLPMEVQERFGELTGGRLVEGYGLTEAAPVTHCNPIYGQRKSGSIGIPFPDVEAKIVDLETGEEIPPGSDRQGELCVRGPQVMIGYWNRPEETAETIDSDGWLHTGDIATIDSDGYFYIVDRKKDMIIASGYKILPREVEEVLYTHPKVLEAVVAGVPDSYRGETVKAYIVPKPGEEPTVEEIIAHCKANLAPYKVPKLIEFRTELPKTIVGKVLRRILVEEEKKKLAEQKAQA